MPMLRHIAAGIAFTLLGGAGQLNAQDPKDKEIAVKARAILTANCYRCHGQNGTVEGGVSYLLDRQQLVARKLVVPNDPSKSKLIQRIENKEMPPEGEKIRPTDDELAVLKQWISRGAPDFNPTAAVRKTI